MLNLHTRKKLNIISNLALISFSQLHEIFDKIFCKVFLLSNWFAQIDFWMALWFLFVDFIIEFTSSEEWKFIRGGERVHGGERGGGREHNPSLGDGGGLLRI